MARFHPKVTIYPASNRAGSVAINHSFLPNNLGLLKEAIRFYNFEEPELVRKRNWESINFALIAEQLDPQRVAFHESLFQMFSRTMENDKKIHRTRIRLFLAKNRLKPIYFSQDAPRLVLKASLSPDWRQRQKQNRRWSWIHIRYFDELVPRLTRLRQLVHLSNVEKILGPIFSDTSHFSNFPSTPTLSIGLTELIYKLLAGHPVDLSLKSEHWFSFTNFTLDKQIRTECNDIRKFIFPLTKGYLNPTQQRHMRKWDMWENGIVALEKKILQTRPILNRQTDPYLYHTDRMAAWGLTLCTILRAFIVDTQAQTMMYALPIDKMYQELNAYGGVGLWEAITGKLFPSPSFSGYFAVPENWSHDSDQDETEAPKNDSGTQSWLNILEQWQHQPYLNHWFPSNNSHDGEPLYSPLRQRGHRQSAIRTLQERLNNMAERPVITAVYYNKKKKLDKIESVTYSAVAQTWQGFPAITYKGFKRIGSNYLNNAASFLGQAHLYVANFLLAVAVEDLGLTLPTEEEQQDVGEKLTLNADSAVFADEPNGDALKEWYEKTYLPTRGQTHSFTMSAGSLHYDGKHPPHKYHRDGATYDINFGHDHRPWSYASKAAQDAIAKAIENQSRMHSIGKYKFRVWKSPLSTSGKKVHPIVKDHWQLMVIQKGTPSFQSRVSKPTPYNNCLVFRKILGRYVKAINGVIRKELRKKVTSDQEFEKGQNLLKCIEWEIYKGFPHFVSARSVQRTHLCHTVLILAGAKQLIYGSPITHIRVLRGIREGLYANDSGAALVNLADPILRRCPFVFMPSDHHNHWHVHFANLANDPISEWKKNVDEFTNNFEFWLMLGVDFSPFIAYLEALTFEGIPETERKYLVKKLISYQKNSFDRLYSLKQEGGVDSLVQARRTMHKIFLLYNDSPYIDTVPTETEPQPYGNYGTLLKTVVEQSEFLLSHLAKHNADLSLQEIAQVLDEEEEDVLVSPDEELDVAPDELLKMPSDDEVEASEVISELEDKMPNSEIEKIPTIREEKKRIRKYVEQLIDECVATKNNKAK